MGGCGSILSTEKTEEHLEGAIFRGSTSDCHPNWVEDDRKKVLDPRGRGKDVELAMGKKEMEREESQIWEKLREPVRDRDGQDG